MRLALRTSGGRGEYEAAGSQASIHVNSVIDHEIVLEPLPGKRLVTNNVIRRVQGKPRVRLANQNADKHVYLTLADVLLLPKPKRELDATPGGKLQLVKDAYSVISIQFDIVEMSGDVLTIRPTNLVLSNSDGDLARVDVIERMRLVLDLWSKAHNTLDVASAHVRAHRDAVERLDVSALGRAAKDIRKAIADDADPLHELLRSYSLAGESTYWMGIHRGDIDSFMVDDDPTDIREAALNQVRAWRFQADRGYDAVRFSKNVKQVYGNRCLFTGYFLPQTPVTGSAGVDSCHILPWAQYELNSLRNGICLSKLCHWAFDAGILRLDFEDAQNTYVLEISSSARQAEKEGLIDLSPFDSLEGPLPANRLPVDKLLWPDPDFLREYNRAMQSL